jgi:hypothetical protein
VCENEHLDLQILRRIVGAHERTNFAPQDRLHGVHDRRSHSCLKLQAKFDDGLVPDLTLKGPLGAGQTAFEDADHQVIIDEGLGFLRPPPYKLLVDPPERI